MSDYTYDVGDVVTVERHHKYDGEFEVLDRKTETLNENEINSYKLDTPGEMDEWMSIGVIDGVDE